MGVVKSENAVILKEQRVSWQGEGGVVGQKDTKEIDTGAWVFAD